MPRLNLSFKSEVDCHQCDTRSCCLGQGLSDEQLHGLRNITHTHGPYQPNQAIFKMEDRFKSLFIIQSGAVKIETISQDGTNLVDGFFLKGDLLGLEAIGDMQYRHDAIALEESWVCELPFEQLESLCSFIPRLQHKILVLLGQKIRYTNDTIVHGRNLSAEKRLLDFLQMLCQRMIMQKESTIGSLKLPMTKGDIASYLGLRPESLSRALKKLQCDGIIRNHSKKIEFLDNKAVHDLVCK